MRAYTKWDYQPTVIDGVPESFARAYSVMMTEPRGPIYMCYDAWLQEQPLEHEVPLPPNGTSMKVPRALAPDPAALERAADMLLAAKRPVILAEYVGREPEGFHALVELAETLGAPVYDVNSRLNFPSRHPLNLSMVKDVFRDADLVLCLDVRDWERADDRARQHHARSSPRSCRRAASGSTSASATSRSRAGRWTTSASRTPTCASSPTRRSRSRPLTEAAQAQEMPQERKHA